MVSPNTLRTKNPLSQTLEKLIHIPAKEIFKKMNRRYAPLSTHSPQAQTDHR